jgi:uncharacterized protein YkwD
VGAVRPETRDALIVRWYPADDPTVARFSLILVAALSALSVGARTRAASAFTIPAASASSAPHARAAAIRKAVQPHAPTPRRTSCAKLSGQKPGGRHKGRASSRRAKRPAICVNQRAAAQDAAPAPRVSKPTTLTGYVPGASRTGSAPAGGKVATGKTRATGKSTTPAKTPTPTTSTTVTGGGSVSPGGGGVAVASGGSCADSSLMPSAANLDRIRAATLCLVNQERTSRSETPLRLNADIVQAAQAHTDDMASGGYVEHVGPRGDTPLSRMRAAGYIYSSKIGFEVGENIAWGTLSLATPRAIVSAWMASPLHRANILNSRFRETGIAASTRVAASLAHGHAAGLYTQDFGVITG